MNASNGPRPLPQTVALLPDRDAMRCLTTGVLQGTEDLPHQALSAACTPLGADGRWEAEPVRELLDEAMNRFAGSPAHADSWLAPRLHSVLRISRREAAESGLWNFLGLCLAPDYALWRHSRRASDGSARPINPRRFCGPFHTQVFSRLWWAAELFRDGADYRPAEIACGNQDVFNTALRMEVVHHRPTAQAIIRLLAHRTVRTGREVNALAGAVNAAGSTLFFEVLAPDIPPDPDAFRAWIDDARAAYIPYDSLPEGPPDGGVPGEAIGALLTLFTKLFDEAPVRGKDSGATEEDRVQEP